MYGGDKTNSRSKKVYKYLQYAVVYVLVRIECVVTLTFVSIHFVLLEELLSQDGKESTVGSNVHFNQFFREHQLGGVHLVINVFHLWVAFGINFGRDVSDVEFLHMRYIIIFSAFFGDVLQA